MPVKTAIHTIRHGHTAYNAEKRYAGTVDVSLAVYPSNLELASFYFSDSQLIDARTIKLNQAGTDKF
jgi:hypothetical protein